MSVGLFCGVSREVDAVAVEMLEAFGSRYVDPVRKTSIIDVEIVLRVESFRYEDVAWGNDDLQAMSPAIVQAAVGVGRYRPALKDLQGHMRHANIENTARAVRALTEAGWVSSSLRLREASGRRVPHYNLVPERCMIEEHAHGEALCVRSPRSCGSLVRFFLHDSA